MRIDTQAGINGKVFRHVRHINARNLADSSRDNWHLPKMIFV